MTMLHLQSLTARLLPDPRGNWKLKLLVIATAAVWLVSAASSAGWAVMAILLEGRDAMTLLLPDQFWYAMAIWSFILIVSWHSYNLGAKSMIADDEKDNDPYLNYK